MNTVLFQTVCSKAILQVSQLQLIYSQAMLCTKHNLELGPWKHRAVTNTDGQTHSLLLTDSWHIFFKYCCLAQGKHQKSTAQSQLGWHCSCAGRPHAGPEGQWEHRAQEPVPSFGVLLWVSEPASSDWKAAQAKYSAAFHHGWWSHVPKALLPHCALLYWDASWREEKLGCIVAQVHGWHTPQTHTEKLSAFTSGSPVCVTVSALAKTQVLF